MRTRTCHPAIQLPFSNTLAIEWQLCETVEGLQRRTRPPLLCVALRDNGQSTGRSKNALHRASSTSGGSMIVEMACARKLDELAGECRVHLGQGDEKSAAHLLSWTQKNECSLVWLAEFAGGRGAHLAQNNEKNGNRLGGVGIGTMQDAILASMAAKAQQTLHSCCHNGGWKGQWEGQWEGEAARARVVPYSVYREGFCEHGTHHCPPNPLLHPVVPTDPNRLPVEREKESEPNSSPSNSPEQTEQPAQPSNGETPTSDTNVTPAASRNHLRRSLS
ncbi:hypothetical protein GGX14DRAFT_384301 [Mycena pura]|uniref:Uncharacterized protein n=1 Tax=Mycena pura TaxID=153505 RepID=A0AAD7E5U0_9AGAR|nr:hypothetical protein GGX14DRAFT_384301 [Mycena pura]